MLVLVLLSLIYVSSAALVNVTIDDTFGDLQTGLKPEYLGTWVSSSSCTASKTISSLCDLGLDKTKLQNGTWMGTSASESSPSVSIVFNGE